MPRISRVLAFFSLTFRGNSGRIVGRLGVGIRPAAGTSPRLYLAALQIFPQRRTQPLLTVRLGLLSCSLVHDGGPAMTAPAGKPRRDRRLPAFARYGKHRDISHRIFVITTRQARRCRSSVVEHPLGKGEVVSSILTGSTIRAPSKVRLGGSGARIF